jgi:hypothetical protein
LTTIVNNGFVPFTNGFVKGTRPLTTIVCNAVHDSAVEWAKERRRAAKLAKAEAAELWPLPEEEIGP